jgi:hypothetical protein
MENRDQMSKNKQSDMDRKTSSQSGKDKSDSSADFGQNKGRSGNMNEPNSRGSKSGGYDTLSQSDRDLDSSSGNSKIGQPPIKDKDSRH